MDNELKPQKKLWKIILTIIIIVFLFELSLRLFIPALGGAFWKTLMNGKYSLNLIAEIVAILIALIFLGARKGMKILTQKRVGFKEAITYGKPIFIITLLLFIGAISGLDVSEINLYNLLSLFLYTFAIGFFEEVFYRGIILKELTNNYNDTRKHIIISIVISAIVFGCAHITNLFAGQDLLTTISQVIQTFGIGIMLGSIYYITDNIWSVIFLHGFYDFVAMLSDVNLIKDCTYASNVPVSVTIQSLVVSIILSIIYILWSAKILKKSQMNKMLKQEVSEEEINDDKLKDLFINKTIWLCVFVLFGFNIVYGAFLPEDDSSYYICYEYETKEIATFETHYYNYNNHIININNASGENIIFNIALSDGKVFLESSDGASINLDIKDVYRVAVIDNKIIIVAIDNVNYKVYYSSGFTKNEFNTSLEYLENIKSSFIEFDVPDLNNVGYMVDVNNNKKYPMVRSTINDYFVIDEDKIYLVK